MVALPNRLVVAITALSVTLSTALGAFVVMPVNDIIGRDLAKQAASAAALAAALPVDAPLPPGVARYASSRDLGRTVLGFRPSAADWAARGRSGYARSQLVGQRAYAVRATADHGLVLVTVDRGGVVERQERIGLALSLVLVLTATLGWAMWAGAAYARRLARVARVARLAADGDFSARAEIRGRDEVGDLARDVDRMAERLGALERARSEFVAKVSHDLRTPLTVIKGYAYTLERHADPQDARRLAAIGRETDRLTGLVDDLLTLSQAGAGALHVAPSAIDPDELLDEVEERLQAFARERDVAIVVESAADLRLYGDRRRLLQVLTNLGHNAVTHTPPGGEVVLCALPAEGGGVDLVVADDGVGIDPDTVQRLLRPFERGTSATPGTGLGLAIAHELVQAHGGTLDLAPRASGGTVATAHLPAGSVRDAVTA